MFFTVTFKAPYAHLSDTFLAPQLTVCKLFLFMSIAEIQFTCRSITIINQSCIKYLTISTISLLILKLENGK